MVEIKNRKRATSPTASSFTRRDDWLDPICRDALPQRDGHEGLTVAPAQSQALREAEKVFQGLRGSGQTAPAESEPKTAAISSESEVVTPRVLPDLRTAAREAEREDVRQPRRNGAANRSTEGQPRKKASAKPLRVPAAGPIIEPAPALYSSDHAEAGYGAQSSYERIQDKTSSWPTLEGAAVTERVLGSWSSDLNHL